MPNHGIAPIRPPTLSNLTKRDLRDFSSYSEVKKYALVEDIANGELFHTSRENKQIKISEHFTAGDFARSRTQKYDFARIHKDLVYELEKISTFFNKPVNIVTGYTSQEEWLKLAEIEENHVAGLAARIWVPSVPPRQLAQFAIFIGKKDTSISVGKGDIILAVNQKNPQIVSHIGEKDSDKRKSRVRREKAIAPLLPYYDYFVGEHRVLLADLDGQYKNLRNELIKEVPNIEVGFRRPIRDQQNEAVQKEIILDLYQKHNLSNAFLVQLLFYSDYYNLYRTYYRLAAYFKRMAKTRAAHQYLAAQEIGAILCPGLKSFRERFNRGSSARHPCSRNPDAIEIPITLQNKTTDKEVLLRLNNLVSEVTNGRSQVPRVQRGVVLGTNSKENREDKPKPDGPKYDITGRYEIEVRTKDDEEFIGQTLVINQAGEHFEGVHSYLHRPPLPGALSNQMKINLQIHGDQEGDHFTGYYYEKKLAGEEITIIRKDRQTLKLLFTYSEYGPYKELEFTKTSSRPRPTHLSMDISGATDLIKYHEWSPLLRLQKKNLVKHFLGKSLKKMDKLLDNYWTSSSRGYQRKQAKEIDDLFYKAFYDRDRGIHPSDNVLTGFYISSLLAKEKWAPDGKQKLSRYDYLRRMVEQEQFRKVKGEILTIRHYLNLPELDSTLAPKTFTYEVSIELHGASFKLFLGGGIFAGRLTIKKTEGDGNWSVGTKATYWVGVAGVAAGAGWNFSIKGKAEFSTPSEWLPEDFSGWGDLVRGSLTGSASVGKLGGSGFFIICDRAVGTFKVEFLNTKVGFQKKAKKPKVEGELSYNKMYIGEPDAEEGALKLKPSEISKDYSLKYGKKSASFNGYDSAFLTDDARNLLRLVCASELPVLVQEDVEIKVKGYTDRVGCKEYNDRLALNRAKNVKLAIRDIMGQKLIIKDENIKAIPLGESLAKKSGDYDDKENPKYRGVKVLINGRVVLTLDAAYSK